MDLQAWRKAEREKHARVRAGLPAVERPAGAPAGPTLVQMAGSLGKSMTRWARAGFRRVREETLRDRRTACQACEHWDAEAFLGTGRCRQCGCGGAKLRLPHEKCPVGKWAPEDPAPTAGPDPAAG